MTNPLPLAAITPTFIEALRGTYEISNVWEQLVGPTTRGFTFKDLVGEPVGISQHLPQIDTTSALTRIVKQHEEQNLTTTTRFLQQLSTGGITAAGEMMQTLGMQYKTTVLPDVRPYMQGEIDSALRSVGGYLSQQGVLSPSLLDRTRARLDFLQPHTPGAIASVLAGSPDIQDLADTLEEELADEVSAVRQVVALRQGSLSPAQWSGLAEALVIYFTSNFPIAGAVGFEPVSAFILSTLVLILSLRRLDLEAAKSGEGTG